MMEIMPDLVDREVLRFRQVALVVKGIFFEEEADLVARSQKVIIANMIAVLARREARHGVLFEWEIVQHLVGFVQKLFHLRLR